MTVDQNRAVAVGLVMLWFGLAAAPTAILAHWVTAAGECIVAALVSLMVRGLGA